MKLSLVAGAAMLILAACGEPEIVTVETLTQEFCDEVVEMMDRPKAERQVKFAELNQRIDDALLAEGVDDEALAFNILGECGDELIQMGASE